MGAIAGVVGDGTDPSCRMLYAMQGVCRFGVLDPMFWIERNQNILS